jgi:hypothetical protein
LVRWLLVTLVILMFVGYWSIRTGRQAQRSLDHDFGVYYRAGTALWEGTDPYHLDHGPLLTFKYAPIVAVGMMPLAQLDAVTARVLWCWLDMLGLVVMFWLSFDLVGVSPKGRRGLVFFVLLMVLGHAVAEFHAGQTSTLWGALVLAAMRDMTRDRPMRSGLWLAGAICVKLVPVALVPYYLFTRRPIRGLAGLALGLAGWLLLPTLFLGWERNLELLSTWPEHLSSTTTIHQATRIQNQSVFAQLARWGGVGQEGGRTLAEVQPIWLGLSLLGAAATYAWIGRHRDRHPAAHLSLLMIYVTAFNPLAWRYNFLALVPAYVYLADGLSRYDGRWLARFGLGVASSVVMTIQFSDELYAAGGRLWGLAWLLVAVWMTVSEESAARRPRPLSGEEAFASPAYSSRGSARADGAVGSAR